MGAGAVQLVALRDMDPTIWTGPAKKGEAVWAPDLPAARHLVENGFCRLHNATPDPQAGGVLARSDSWPVDRFAIVRPLWKGATVLCIGGGPSAGQANLAAARGRAKVIAVNDAYLLAPWADICYFADYRWWEWHRERPEFARFAGQRCTIDSTGMRVPDPAVYMLHNAGNTGLSAQDNAVVSGSNSGYQAVNIAVLAGAKRVLLIGYDMRFPGGRSHWHGGHPPAGQRPEQLYANYAGVFTSMVAPLKALGCEVVNCTPDSAITCFRFGELEQELAGG